MEQASRCMSTQHPDNVRQPFFAHGQIMQAEDEIKEAYYAFTHLGIKEQLWDFEGKESDSYVVKKLLSSYDSFFKKYKLGQDFQITYRVPNPDVERNDAKVLLETLESIPRSFDAAKLFYGQDQAPIKEVYLPMCTSSSQLIRVSEYYKKFISGKAKEQVADTTVGKWIGDFKPESIRVTGLFEDKDSILDSHNIVESFVKSQKVKDYQRVWFARSDPAINYGSIATVLIVKLGLIRLHKLEKKLNLDILPIIGCGSAPFRGNLKPTNVDTILKGYPSVQTYTLQSAFKYDYTEKDVRDAVSKINLTERKSPVYADESKILPIINKLSRCYQEEIRLLAPFVNDFAKFIPQRRKRKLHIGLFGYQRQNKDMHLPRAITFCASFYSWGLPPEILGITCLSKKDIEQINTCYGNFEADLKDSLKLFNQDNLKYFPKAIQQRVSKAAKMVDFNVDENHKKATSFVPLHFKSKNMAALEEAIVSAGQYRGFLG